MGFHVLGDAVALTQIIPPASRAAGTTTPSTYIDSTGYEAALFVLSHGVFDATNTQLQVLQATDATGTGSKNVTGATFVAITGGANKVYAIEINRQVLDIAGGFKFITASLVQTGGSATITDVLLIQHQARVMPTNAGNAVQFVKVTN